MATHIHIHTGRKSRDTESLSEQYRRIMLEEYHPLYGINRTPEQERKFIAVKRKLREIEWAQMQATDPSLKRRRGPIA